MKFYVSGDKLIQFNPETKVARQRNTISRRNQVIPLEEFDVMDKKPIKKNLFSQKLNEYFKDIRVEWEHNGTRFRKLPNLTDNDYNRMPKHKLPNSPYAIENYSYIIVYHQGGIYYMLWSYGGYESGQLFDIKTGSFLRWAKPRHCAPILNVDKNVII